MGDIDQYPSPQTPAANTANPPACRVYNNANIAIVDAVSTALTFNSERYDTNNMHSTSTNTGRITFNTAGLYLVLACVEFTGRNDWQNEAVSIRLNGTTNIVNAAIGTVANGTVGPIMAPSTMYKFAVADYVEVVIYGHNGASAGYNAAYTTGASPEFSATWLGVG